MSVYFSHQDGHYPPKFPTCDYMEIYNQYNCEKIRLDDTKRINMFKEMGYSMHETRCGIHYFDENGFLQCKICGWTP